MIDLESVACFMAAARTLNFRTAASTRGLSAAAFGKRIRQLEEVVGAVLFHRTTRRVELTEGGRAFVAPAQRLLAAAQACEQAVGSDQEPPTEVTLGTRHELGMSWILPVRRRLAAALPQLTIHLYFGSGQDLERRLLDLAVDCAVTSRAPSTSRLDGLVLHREEYVFVGSPGLLARVPLEAAGDAAKHTLIDTSEDLPLFRYVDPGDAHLGFGRVLHMGTIAAIRALTLDGEGVSVLPHYFVREDLSAGRLRPVLSALQLRADSFRLLFRADDPRRRQFEQMAREMRRAPLC